MKRSEPGEMHKKAKNHLLLADRFYCNNQTAGSPYLGRERNPVDNPVKESFTCYVQEVTVLLYYVFLRDTDYADF